MNFLPRRPPRRRPRPGLACALVALLAVAAMSTTPAPAQPGPEDVAVRTASEIRIDLPRGQQAQVSVVPGTEKIELELPEGAAFPLDFAASSGGMLREGKVSPLGNGRLRLELDLALGLLSRVDYAPESVTLRFESRYDMRREGEGDDPGDMYEMGPDDLVKITVHGHEDLSGELVLTRDGYITMPLISEVKAEGLTPRQLAAKLTELYGRDYLVDPQIDISIEEYNSQWVTVDGEVRAPGRYPLKGGTQLKDVVSESRGFTDEAGEEITIQRSQEGLGGDVTIEINRRDYERGDSNPHLVHEDIITVSRATYCYVQGEVNSPARIRVVRGVTLARALAMAGGLTDWANRKAIKVLDGESSQPVEYNLRRILEGKDPDPPLYGGEIVVVERRFF